MPTHPRVALARKRGAAEPLSEEAIWAYRIAGWAITERDHADYGTTLGPCALCQATHHRYGPDGHPFCARCRTGC